jgi:hypothetical protein
VRITKRKLCTSLWKAHALNTFTGIQALSQTSKEVIYTHLLSCFSKKLVKEYICGGLSKKYGVNIMVCASSDFLKSKEKKMTLKIASLTNDIRTVRKFARNNSMALQQATTKTIYTKTIKTLIPPDHLLLPSTIASGAAKTFSIIFR